MQTGQAKARQSHLGGRVALTEGFLVTGMPVGCREIHAAARLGQGSWLGSAGELRKQYEAGSSRRQAA